MSRLKIELCSVLFFFRMASDLTEQLALGNMEPPPPYVIQEEHSVQTSGLTGSKQTIVDEQRSRAASGEPNWLASSTSEVMIRTARSCSSLNEGKKVNLEIPSAFFANPYQNIHKRKTGPE